MSDYNRYSSVNNMLSTLGWKSLQQRRNIQTLYIFYKILNGLVDVEPPDCLTPGHLATRGHNKKFCQIPTRIDAYKFSFFHKAVNLWNTLTDDFVNAPNLDSFTFQISNIIN